MDSFKQRPKKALTPQMALAKAEHYCAYQERCHEEVRTKLYDMGLYPSEVENIISLLIESNFLNEERFAVAYAGGKFRVKNWGRIKITHQLKLKKISPYCIRKAIAAIDEDEYLKTLQELVAKKDRETKGDLFSKKKKIAAYIGSKGFEPDLTWEVIHDYFSKTGN